VETGLHNSGYVSDVTDSNDLFMMMDTRKKVSVEDNKSNTLDRAAPASFQVGYVLKKHAGYGTPTCYICYFHCAMC